MIKLASSVPNDAARQLQQQILNGSLPAGSMLPGQRELSARMGISRASLREAISMLEALGMLSSQPGRGVLVTHGRHRSEAELPIGPAAIPAVDMYQFRIALEPVAAALAASRITPSGASQLWAIQQNLEQAIDDNDLIAASEADLAFHLSVAQRSGNAMFQTTIGEAPDPLAHNLRLAFADPQRVRETAEEHRLITLAITAGDALEARNAMRAHLEHTAERAGISLALLQPPTS